MGGRGRWEGGSGWGIHVTPWLIHVSVWQKPLQYCKVISLQLIKINGKKKREEKKNLARCGDLSMLIMKMREFRFFFLRGLAISSQGSM